MKFNGEVKILSKRWLAEDVFQWTLDRTNVEEEIKVGQFFNVVASKTGFPLLRRPISVSGFDKETFELTIKVLGKGTHELSTLNVGDAVQMMGPLGNGFDLVTNEKTLVIGGGIGVAPLKGLIENARFIVKADVILGFRDEPYLVEAFQEHSDNVRVVSETDSRYEKGFVTGPLLEQIAQKHYDMVYTCGPQKMLQAVAKILNDKGVKTQLLMEEKMACGVGACLVCTCKTKNGDFGFKHSRMCKEGPMFYASEVIFDEE